MWLYLMVLTIVLAGLSASAGEWKLVWSDEFDHKGPPDKTKWSYEEGFLRNDELQYYMRERADNARVDKGMLVLEARKERFKNPSYDPAKTPPKPSTAREFAEYTSASLVTLGKAAWRYGRIEVRAKLPAGKGMWPAIWLLGTNIGKIGWPTCGEIDIMEYVGFDPKTIYGTIHTAKYNHVKGTQKGSKLEVADPAKRFHVYAAEWGPEAISLSVDQKQYFTFPNEHTGAEAWPFDAEFYLILNIAVGGSWGGQKGVDDSIFPQRMLVDYVRVYQQAGEQPDKPAGE